MGVLAFVHWRLFDSGGLLLGYLVALMLMVTYLWRAVAKYTWAALGEAAKGVAELPHAPGEQLLRVSRVDSVPRFQIEG